MFLALNRRGDLRLQFNSWKECVVRMEPAEPGEQD